MTDAEGQAPSKAEHTLHAATGSPEQARTAAGAVTDHGQGHAAPEPGTANPFLLGPLSEPVAAGKGSQSRALAAERDLGLIRLAIITFNVLVYVFWIPKEQGILWLAIAVSIVALGYALLVVLFEPYRHFAALRTSIYTAVTDSALIALWIMATGGIDSPFYPLWSVSLVAVAFRYGARPTLATGALYIVGDVGVLWVTGALPGQVPAATVRAVYIGFVGAVGAMLGRQWERAVRDRARLSSRLATREAERREQQRFQILAEAALEAILIHDRGVLLEANQAACRLFGQTREELIGTHVASLIHADSWGEVEQRLRSPTDEQYEIKIRRKDGSVRLAQVQARDLEFQGRSARVTAVRDITEQREAEEARRVQADQRLEIERLQEIDKFRTQFINAAAHELNTPLTPLRLQLSVLKRAMQDQPRSMVILERNLNRLSTLVQDMLDISRLQAGRLRILHEKIDVGPVLEEAVETFGEAAHQKQITLDLHRRGGLWAYGDPTRLFQVLNNLLSNAVKFTPAGGQVTVAAHTDGPEVVMEVEDTGMGLDEDQQELLFQPFSQVHDDRFSIPGTGLGLFICRRLVEGMGGRIWVESEGRGLGSRFSFTLPVQPVVVPGKAEVSSEGVSKTPAGRADTAEGEPDGP